MIRVKIPAWLLCVLCGAVLVLGGGLAVSISRAGDFRDGMERAETALHAAQDSASVLVGQLGNLAIDNLRIEQELIDAMATVEHGQELGAELAGSIDDSADASGIIGNAIDGIGDFIFRVEKNNAEAES